MGKIKCTKLAEEMGWEAKDVLERANAVLKPEQMTGGKSPHFTYFTEEGADIIRRSEEAPLTVAMRYKARGWRPAKNPRWLFCKVEGFDGVHPVAIPRKLQGRLLNKPFVVEAIEDINGITFRHEALAS